MIDNRVAYSIVWQYTDNIFCHIIPLFIENGNSNRVPVAGNNMSPLATEISNLKADKKTENTSATELCPQKLVGKKSRKK